MPKPLTDNQRFALRRLAALEVAGELNLSLADGNAVNSLVKRGLIERARGSSGSAYLGTFTPAGLNALAEVEATEPAYLEKFNATAAGWERRKYMTLDAIRKARGANLRAETVMLREKADRLAALADVYELTPPDPEGGHHA